MPKVKMLTCIEVKHPECVLTIDKCRIEMQFWATYYIMRGAKHSDWLIVAKMGN
jgi:hypothetical protein